MPCLWNSDNCLFIYITYTWEMSTGFVEKFQTFYLKTVKFKVHVSAWLSNGNIAKSLNARKHMTSYRETNSYGYRSRITVIHTESRISNPSSNSDLVFCIHFCTYALGKGINPSLLTPAMVKKKSRMSFLVLGGKQTNRRTTLDWRLWSKSVGCFTPTTVGKTTEKHSIVFFKKSCQLSDNKEKES